MLSKLGRPATEVSACQNTAALPCRRTVPDPGFWAWSLARSLGVGSGLPALSPESFLSWEAEVLTLSELSLSRFCFPVAEGRATLPGIEDGPCYIAANLYGRSHLVAGCVWCWTHRDGSPSQQRDGHTRCDEMQICPPLDWARDLIRDLSGPGRRHPLSCLSAGCAINLP